MTTSLSVNLSDLRTLCRDQIARGAGFDARELASVVELLGRMEAEAFRLETLEAEAAIFEMAERSARLRDNYPPADAAAISSANVVAFPGRRDAPERRPS